MKKYLIIALIVSNLIFISLFIFKSIQLNNIKEISNNYSDETQNTELILRIKDKNIDIVPEELVKNKKKNLGIDLDELEKLKENIKNIDCKTTQSEYTVNGVSMLPILENGEKVTVIEGHYSCSNVVNRGDIVIYKSKSVKTPIIKQVKVLPEDEVIIDEIEGYLLVNGSIMKNSKGDIYKFNDVEKKFLGIYLDDDRKMQLGAYFIFGDNVGISNDSRKFGAVGIEGFIGKINIY